MIKDTLPPVLTWMVEFRPRKLTTWVVFDVDSESEVQNAYFLHLDPQNLGKKIPIEFQS